MPSSMSSPSIWSPAASISRSWSTRTAATGVSTRDIPSSSAVIDLKLLRAPPDQVRSALARRGDAAVTRLLDELEALDMRRRALAGQLDQLKAERNEAAKADARLMKEKGELPTTVREQRRKLGEGIAGLETQLRDMMVGTGQLPKFEEDAYRTEPDDLFLVPTAEVPVTNLHRDEILDGAILPRGYVSYTPCFRREAGAAGKDTRGLLRVHQFDKVELVRFCRASDSPVQHETLTGHAETVLQKLELPYRVVVLPANDLGFAGAKTYDLEAWAPGVAQWLEVSSSSTFTDYQARRANIRCRPRPGEKPEFVHTLNASGVALPRTIAVTDTAGRITALDNAPFGAQASETERRAWVAELDRIHRPLIQPHVGTIHYGALPAARAFTGLAVLQGVMFLCLALLAGWAMRERVR